MDKNDSKHLNHMLDAAKDAMAFVKNRSRDDLDTDKQLTLSLLKSFEMIGEASARVSKECRNACEPIPVLPSFRKSRREMV